MNDSERYLTELERDPEYRAARINKLRREYGRVFVTFGLGRQARLNAIEDELKRLGDTA